MYEMDGKEYGELVVDGRPFEVRRREYTVDGFLDVWGVAAKVGLHEYPDKRYPDGKRVELIPAEALREVDGLIGVPFVIEHPASGFVTPDNAEKLSGGTVLDASFDEATGEQRVRIRVTRRSHIEALESKKYRMLSPGYYVKREFDGGVDPEHGEYDSYQVRRLPNHLAATRSGRRGPEAGLNLDSKGAQMEDELKELKARVADLEGIVAERDSKITSLTQDLDRVTAERDIAQDSVQVADSAEGFARKYEAHKTALAVAQRLGLEAKATDSTDDLRRACVAKQFEHRADIDVSKKSDVYVEMAFDRLALEVDSLPDSSPSRVAQLASKSAAARDERAGGDDKGPDLYVPTGWGNRRK